MSATPANDQHAEVVAASQDEIAALAIPESDITCPIFSCGASLYAFSRPLGGWRGTINGPNAGIFVQRVPSPLAIEGRTIASGGLDGIDLFTITPGPPSARNASLSGLAIGRPRLRFALDAGQNAAPIRSFKLSLPRGVRFASHLGGRTRGVRISVPARVAILEPVALTVTLRRPAKSMSVTVDPSAIIEQNSLIAQIRGIRRYNRTHRRKRAVTLSTRCLVTDATGHNTPLALTTRIS